MNKENNYPEDISDEEAEAYLFEQALIFSNSHKDEAEKADIAFFQWLKEQYVE